MRLGLKRIPKENQHVNLLFADHRAELLIAAKRPALEAAHVQANKFSQHTPGRSCRNQRVLTQAFSIVLGPLDQEIFFVVMGNERNGVRGHSPLSHTLTMMLM